MLGEEGTVRRSAGAEGTQGGLETWHHPGTASAHRERWGSVKKLGVNLEHI